MPVIRPSAGGTSLAIAIPRHNGSATRNTTTEAMSSRANPRASISSSAPSARPIIFNIQPLP